MIGEQGQRHYWEARAATHQRNVRGVLFQGLPANLNELIHTWHAALVYHHFAAILPPEAQVVDLAAGYGRLSKVIGQARPDVSLHGADLSLTYSELYQAEIGPALCADLAALPYSPASWDGILLVTGLMYLPPDKWETAITELLATLKPDGLLFCLDPGRELILFLRRLGIGQQASASDGFSLPQYLTLFNRANCNVISKGSNGWFTLLLPIVWLLSSLSHRMPLLLTVLNKIIKLDGRATWLMRVALHRWVLVQKL